MDDTDVMQSRTGKVRTLAEVRAHIRVAEASKLVASAGASLRAAHALVDRAHAEFAAAHNEELAAMRAAAEGEGQ
jgi:hypothetical protein